MKRRSIYISVLALSLVLGACDLFRGGDNGVSTNRLGPILFVSDESGSSQLYSMQPYGFDVRQHTFDPEFEIADAVWSPDGRWIILTEDRPSGPDAADRFFYLVDDDLRRESACQNIAGSNPVWSSDSNTFVYRRGASYVRHAVTDRRNCIEQSFSGLLDNSRTRISDWSSSMEILLGETELTTYDYSLDKQITSIRASFWTLNGDTLYTIGKIGDSYNYPIWSSDEKSIAVSIRHDGVRRLYRVSTDGSDLRRLTGDEYQTIVPIAWSADDTTILVRAWKESTGNVSILMMDAYGGSTKDISPFPGANNRPTSWRTDRPAPKPPSLKYWRHFQVGNRRAPYRN